MYYAVDRNGTIIEGNSAQDRLLSCLYGHFWGRLLLRPLITPAFSELGGRLLDSRASRLAIKPFLRSHSIDMHSYVPKRYDSYNDFFKRELRQGLRPVEQSPEVLVSPCDGRLCVYRINRGCAFSIKHARYTVESLLRDASLARAYAGGYVWAFRLQVEDYHHYIYVDDGFVSEGRQLSGIFHTVNPAAGERFPIYQENTREYALLHSRSFGTVIQMEVGALLVGKIENRPGGRKVRRGQEKGNFAFGGSTVILLTEPGKAVPDGDILRNSIRGMETVVKLGEGVGRKK